MFFSELEAPAMIKSLGKSAKVTKKAVAKRVTAKPVLLSGGNPQIAKAYRGAPVRA